MAAAEEEGSQSENKNDDPLNKSRGKPFSTMHQEIESKLIRPGVSYEDRVGIILSGWDHLAGTASTGQLPFATFLYKWTLQLVLQGEWPKLEKIVKTRLRATLQRCMRDPMMQPMCCTLLPLVTDPWGHQTLKAIIAGSYVSDEETEQYILEETWPVVRQRVNTLVESRCEELALSVLKVCMRCIKTRSNMAEMLLNSQEDHNHFVDLYFVLLYKFQRKQFLEEVRQVELLEGVDHVRRLLAQQEKGKVWKHRLKIAELEVQIFLASCIVKPFEKVFGSVFSEWCNVMREVNIVIDVLVQMVRKYIQLAESSQHIYTMGSILHHKFGEMHAALVTELLIRALTVDMNALEGIKLLSREGNIEDQTRFEHQMAEGFMDLSIVFEQHEFVARECVLTAFSLHPTHNRLEKLKSYGLPSNNDKTDSDLIPENDSNVNVRTECVLNEGISDQIVPNRSEDSAVAQCERMVNRDNENLKQTDSLFSNNDNVLSNVDSENQSDVKILDTGQNSCESNALTLNGAAAAAAADDTKDNDLNSNPNSSPFLTRASKHLSSEIGCETQCLNESLNVCDVTNNKVDNILPVSENKLPVGLVDDSNANNTDHKAKTDSFKRDIWEFVDETEEGFNHGQSISKTTLDEAKVKEDVDSMDGFLATAEGLIEQLNQGKEEKIEVKKEPVTNEAKQLGQYDVLSDSQAILSKEKLGISKELCDDLAVVLSSPRWQVLTWMLEKYKLLTICEKYLRDSDSAKNVTKELKFLNIDYSQFQHLPSVEVDEFSGIEKGYEHFIEKESDVEDYFEMHTNNYSSGSEIESKRSRGSWRRGRRGRPPLRGRYFNSDSDSTGRSKSRTRTTTSFSESEDSDFESLSSRFRKDEEFEGKRITAISSSDRRKRLRIDATTGRVKRSRGKTRSVSHLRLYRHQSPSRIPARNLFLPSPLSTSTISTSVSANNRYASKQGTLNVNQSVVLTHYDRTSMDSQIHDPLDSGVTTTESLNFIPTAKTEANNNSVTPKEEGDKKPPYKPTPFQRGRYNGNWRYAGYVISRPQKDSNLPSSVPVASPPASTVRCSYRTREGRLVTLNTRNYVEEENSANVEYLRKLGSPSSKFEESFAKFLMQQKSDVKGGKTPSVTITRKTMPLKNSFEYLKRQGTSVIFKKSNGTSALANAQKNVLNRIMSPENSRHGIVGRSPNQQLPVRAIAMPVSHNPPNLPPSDKSNPTGLSRVLPKGTTVVRRPKADTGAGPSGLNNGGTAAVISRSQGVRALPPQPRPTISITPSNNFLGSATVTSFSNTIPARSNLNQTSLASNFNPLEGPSTSFPGTVSPQTESENFPPLASATVVGSVSQTLSPRLNSNTSSPGETQGSCFVSLNSSRNTPFINLNQAASCTTTTTVATLSGETRAPSMLETLLRDRSTPSSPLVLPLSSSGSPAPTTTTTSIPDPIVASSPAITGNSVSASSLSEAVNLVTSHSNLVNTSNSDVSVPVSASGSGSISNVGDSSMTGSMASNINLGVSNIPVVGSSMPTTVLSTSLPASVISSGVGSHVTVSTGGTSTTGDPPPTGMHQLLLPAQFIQVQGSDGSTGLGIVHSGSLDLRLPPGTRVIKSSTSNMRPSAPVAMSQSTSRPLNVLHNVKIVQNRQIVRTVVVPHSVALQSLGGQQTAQLVALSQSPGTSNNGLEAQTGSKISSQLQKMLGHNVVPGGLVIRAVRPPTSEAVNEDAVVSKPPASTIIQHTSEVQQPADKEKEGEKSKVVPLQAQEEGLAERLSRHYLKTALLASTSTQSVGTQTQTTAVKPVTGQLVNQVVMNHLRGIGGNSSISSIPVGATPVVASAVPSSSGLSPLSLGPSNAVSSETLEQLREFESVFEKVSNKSVKDNETGGGTNQQNFPTSNISSEESMIAAQLLSMANDTTPTVTSTSSYVYTIPTSSSSSDNTAVTLSSSTSTTSISTSAISGTRLGEGTFITIPSSTQAGTLILVNPSVATSGTVTMTSGVQTTQPPPAASPALSSTSSHSSVASSPSSTSSKSKSKSSKPKAVTPPSAPVTPTKPKSPPPPKAPPKPTVAKPQVEESDETKARIQAILDQYKQDLANTPQPQPAPRNRKNCPPPKNEGKSSTKKKSQVKKPDGTSNTSPGTSDSGHLPSVSPSPAPLAVTPSGEDSEGSIGGTSATSSQFQSQEEKTKPEDSVSPQILQGVVVSNVKVDNSGLGNNLAALPQGRVVQLIRHGSKVTAITTRQPYQKTKAGLASGGPPPNVTIQGRINMNELMESHLASLLAGGSSTINQSSALITKLIQAQQQQSPSVQQVVVQTSGGMGQQVIQQVSLQPVIATHTKTSQIQGQLISGGTTIPDSSNQHINSPIKTPTHPQPSPIMSLGVSPSPGTPQQRASSPSTPSPAPELPSTPSSFPTAGEESNSSDDSIDGAPAAPLPPFFTLTKQFMVPQQSQQFSEKSLSDSASQVSLTPTSDAARSTSKLSSDTSNNSSTVNLTSQPTRSTSFIRTSFAKSMNCPSSQGASKSGITCPAMLAHSAPPSPLVVAPGENVLDMSPVSGPSSLEGSPSLLSHRLPLVTTSELRSSSLDSVKSDLSVEEVQIPPSPATLTKQLQNAYMTEAALSPTVSQSHLSSSSSYSSPTTVQDLQFVGEQRVLSPNLGHVSHTYSLAGQSSSTSSLSNASNCSVSHNNPSMENNSLACLSSPSGDVYLDQAGVGLGLDSLPLVEGRPQSPSLSDLVPAVPLLSWSPRSADSIMGQSPSLNEALTGNMTLDVHHSEDSLCDSSTGFPGLFAMDGDGASVSSSSSDDILNSNNTPCPPISSTPSTSAVFSIAPSQPHTHMDHPHIAPHNSFGKRLPNHEQDHTISSTRSEDLGSHLSSLELPHPGPGSDDSELLKQDESNSSTIPEDDPWKFTTVSKNSSTMDISFVDESPASPADDKNESANNELELHHSFLNQNKKNPKRSNSENQNFRTKRENEQGLRRRRSQRQIKDSEKGSQKVMKEEVHNGYEEKFDDSKNVSDDDIRLEDVRNENIIITRGKKQINSDDNVSIKSKPFKSDLKEESEGNLTEDEKRLRNAEMMKKELKSEGEELVSRLTRGSKRRSDSDFVQEEKRSRSSRSRRSEPVSELCVEDDKATGLLDEVAGGPLTRSLRGRHVSGTSDSSSNYSVDRVSTPGPQDSPVGSGSGGSRRRKRRGSHDSSVSSRDGSPLTIMLSSQQDGGGSTGGGIHTRRSSSRDHAKKTRCRCCVDQSSGGGSGRRASGRVSRGSGPPSSTS